MKRRAAIFVLLVAAAACDDGSRARAWRLVQQQALPGPVSTTHALATDCATCHTPLRGVEASSCIACHALNGPLVERQSTAFHAVASECAGCHVEHAGRAALRGPMDHDRFAALVGGRSEAHLDCMTCHERQDPHSQLLGSDCAACHATERWTIAAYRHPSARSRNCVQCHAAPPSHFMEHFAMVSARVARREHAGVSDCFSCHLTTHWNDIRGVGFYDHH